MKALTVQQPWAWAIIAGGKNIENRHQIYGYRGTLAIHAGKRWSERGALSRLIVDTVRRHDHGDTRIEDRLGRRERVTEAGFVMGAIIGTVELVDSHYCSGCCAPWGEESYVDKDGHTVHDVAHQVLKRPRIFEDPIPARGMLGLWTPGPELQELIDYAIFNSKPGGA